MSRLYVDAKLPKVMECAAVGRSLKILVLYSRVPFPMMRGDQLTVAHLLSFLYARGHEVDLLATDVDGSMNSQQHAWLNSVCQRVDLISQGKFDQFKGLIKGLFGLRPFQVGLFQNDKITRIAGERIAAGEYDIVYCYYLRSITAVPAGFGPNRTQVFAGRRTAAFLAMQLSQTLNTSRIYTAATGLKRMIFGFEWWLMHRFEARVWQLFTKVMLIGPKDVEAVEQACLDEGVPIINNWLYGAHGTDLDAFRPAYPSEVMDNRIIFSGSMLYLPNVQAVLWFRQHCWPTIRAAQPDVEWYIVGRDPVDEVRALHGKDNITVTGTVPDVGVEIRKAAICINPMVAAGGMQNKLIEYLASSKASVVTSVANEGILAPFPEVVRIADTPEAFSREVLSLLQDRRQREALGAAARTYALENWTWEAHFLKLEEAFFDALRSA
jgi:glycosyltransferase involved in cell wall biosynthesis